MKPVFYALIGLFLLLQYPLWFGSGGALAYWRLHQGINAQVAENKKLRERNESLKAEVIDLKSGQDAIEERARSELGMVKANETFYQVVNSPRHSPRQ
ncbi:MAG: cell division protein FtsB [Acidiferrobacterales bacterium]